VALAQVYDVTRFLNKHPGGKTLILSVSGAPRERRPPPARRP